MRQILIACVLLFLFKIRGLNTDGTMADYGGDMSKSDEHDLPTTTSQLSITTRRGRVCHKGQVLRKKCRSECIQKEPKQGLASTPPMGWLAWERFRCNTDCDRDPDNCISERLFMKMADLMVRDGYANVGYEYVNVDDCWMAKTRDSQGRLQPDPQRFPNGIKALADYVHSRGLKFGIYINFGNYTCGGYPGSIGYLETDANTIAGWGVDYVKMDACYSKINELEKGYISFGSFLRKTGRPIVYSCSWPAYEASVGLQSNWTALTETCHLWRYDGDIDDSWQSVEAIIDYYTATQDIYAPLAGPGHWNDPDMLIIGNFGLSYEQSKSQMAIWAIMAAPLLMSVDLRTIGGEYRRILQNKDVIAINQDKLGIQGRYSGNISDIQLWIRPIRPIVKNHYSYAVAFLSRRSDGIPFEITVLTQDMRLTHENGYRVRDLFTKKKYGVILPKDQFVVRVKPSGVTFLRFIAVDDD